MALLDICIGVEDFREVRENGYCYVDKTSFIEEMLRTPPPKVSLITRPRRFGKTLTMSMLQEFFEIRLDGRAIFEGLAVFRNTALCEKWMNRYPTLFLTLKGVEGADFRDSLIALRELAVTLCSDNAYLLESGKVAQTDKALLQRVMDRAAEPAELAASLQILCRALKAYWGKPVILLIDEYDTPVNCAEQNGYYKETVGFMRSFLGAALKTNPTLKFAVLTGCLRIAKESIFTGLNNFMCYTVSDADYADKFGFTETEIDGLLKEADLSVKKAELKEWYDGYRFGENTEIYCPWEILMHLSKLQKNPRALPQAYWNNTSGNSIVKTLINRAGRKELRSKIETLIEGGSVEEELAEDLTYDIVYDNESNIWTMLYLTGYLTKADKQPDNGLTALVIPNNAVRKVFTATVSKWFKETLQNLNLSSLAEALWNGDCACLQKMLTQILYSTISYFDSAENYYHGFMTGLIRGAGLSISSNGETGLGRADIVIDEPLEGRAVIIELKCAREPEELEAKAEEALRQIGERKYALGLDRKISKVMNYGIAFWRKECCVKATATAR